MKPLLLLTVLGISAAAQTPGDPFTLIRVITRPPIPAAESSIVRSYSNARAAVDVLGLRSIAGVPQVWHVEAHGSFASLEALDKGLASADEVLGGWTSMIGIYRPVLSYRPDEAVKLLPSARYFQVSMYRIRPGTEIDFLELMRIRRSAFDSINVDRPEIGYQIISGGTSGTYIFFSPLPSLRSIDNALAKMPVYGETTVHVGSKAGRDIANAAEVTREGLIFRVEPRISYVSDAFAASDPEFWRGRTEQR